MTVIQLQAADNATIFIVPANRKASLSTTTTTTTTTTNVDENGESKGNNEEADEVDSDDDDDAEAVSSKWNEPSKRVIIVSFFK